MAFYIPDLPYFLAKCALALQTSATRDSLPAFVYRVTVDTRQHVTDS